MTYNNEIDHTLKIIIKIVACILLPIANLFFLFGVALLGDACSSEYCNNIGIVLQFTYFASTLSGLVLLLRQKTTSQFYNYLIIYAMITIIGGYILLTIVPSMIMW